MNRQASSARRSRSAADSRRSSELAAVRAVVPLGPGNRGATSYASVEARLFRTLNGVIEPHVRAGFGSLRFVPGGLIVLETRGRRTGRRSRVPLAAVRIQGHTIVSTFRGRRSDWVKNLAAEPRVRYWLHGRPRSARAVVLPPDGRGPRGDDLPRTIRWLLPFLEPYRCAGWAFAILSPDGG